MRAGLHLQSKIMLTMVRKVEEKCTGYQGGGPLWYVKSEFIRRRTG